MKVRSACPNLLSQKTTTIRSVAQVIAFLVSSFPAVEYAKIHYRHLELDKISALRANKGNFDSIMALSVQSKTKLTWWVNNVLTASKPISHGNPDLTLPTDVSNVGWGAVCGDTSTGGFWSLEEQRYLINFLDLKAVLLGLKSLCGAFSEKHVLVQSDNTTTVAYINAMGGIKSIPCNETSGSVPPISRGLKTLKLTRNPGYSKSLLNGPCPRRFLMLYRNVGACLTLTCLPLDLILRSLNMSHGD